MVLQTEQTERLRKALHIDITDGIILAVMRQGRRQENDTKETMEAWMERHVFVYASTPKVLETMKKEFSFPHFYVNINMENGFWYTGVIL